MEQLVDKAAALTSRVSSDAKKVDMKRGAHSSWSIASLIRVPVLASKVKMI